ncbi:hypothetical protein CRG98_047613 [Punica granatum]|uniref:Pentatricopeptide repeat-containing protein n=1 Tax=Punica granatum TaxID=22663 RepID=A0A2I0HJX9_PUNGR|nr:hypothetical protein CRG98_047613 [Punica granatum]
MPRRDKFPWTSMNVGLAVNGHGEALCMFSEILRVSIKPDEVTYIGVLTACSHPGMVEQGRELFSRMTAQHGIELNLVHFRCLVDLLGRSGLLEEAHKVLYSMPLRPKAVIWGALFGACRAHKYQEMMWEKLSEQRRAMTDGNGSIHKFVAAGDESHPQSDEIYAKLDETMRELRLAGCRPDTSEVFLDMEERK